MVWIISQKLEKEIKEDGSLLFNHLKAIEYSINNL